MLTRRPEAEQALIDIYLHVSRDNPQRQRSSFERSTRSVSGSPAVR